MEWNKEKLEGYAPNELETKWYDFWEREGYFHEAPDPAKEPFSIVMPPPNVTGQLHMGHALDNTLQDILVRFKRMAGYNVAWIPGTDHAGIATQVKVEEQLAKEEGKTRYDIGRDEFLKRVWAWKEQYGGRIEKQVRRLGSSCDWSRKHFTMDDTCARAVREVFVSLYERGLIYQGQRITNWCPHCNTALSDIEVDHSDEQGHLWYVNYPVVGEDRYVTIATTRPETIMGDTAVAVNPQDPRFAGMIGKKVVIPLVHREVEIIADEYVDPEFGTGAVKITPAHDPNDFEMGQRHHLEAVMIMNLDGTMNSAAGKKYDGMTREECRKAVVADLQELGLLDHVEELNHAVGHCSRCKTIVEPFSTKQWFVKMKPLTTAALDAVKDGKTEFVPDRFSKTYNHWLEDVHDWCISRQLWWGHQIPAWYCADCGETSVSREDLTECPHCHSKHITQDPDVLDTWFSSALWPFSTMGWPDRTADIEQFFPTSVLVTGYDIIFFWVARMMFMTCEFMKEIPFRHVFIHGLVRDSQGRKMSKSLGNGIDPLGVCEEYGADALRFTLVTGNTPGNDMRFYMERVEANRNFANKIWNAAKFVIMNLDDYDAGFIPETDDFTLADRWILSTFNDTVRKVTEKLDSFELGDAADAVYNYIWNSFCDWYIELAKQRLYKPDDKDSRKTVQYVLIYVLTHTLELLHPFMPFVTEHLWQHLPHEGKSIIVAPWPQVRAEWDFSAAAATMNTLMEAIKNIRNMRAEANVPMGKRAPITLVPADDVMAATLRRYENYFFTLAFADGVNLLTPADEKPENAVVAVVPGIEIYLQLKDLIDVEKETARVRKEQEKMTKEIERLVKKLSNQGFLAKAPADVVDKEKEKLAGYRERLQALTQRMETLEKL
ncbi:valine--tRNA ligase [Megasphaera vaginalis (ex Bordigoni et al. 2020)]|uniref:valine--tRNA ligase n=1 Tax=Megasphaera vaginalis (ex Bordigoni et al. 2020) TaxID=2045301 RepID=UPI000C7A3A6F|nr:valine--tRNA ligase [Megasphaera vaginalis (ex Bordigoni et al. 2020)]